MNNTVLVKGTIASNPVFDYNTHGENFFKLTLRVSRLSKHNDMLPIVISERLLDITSLNQNDTICVRGQFRSYNKLIDGKSKLMLHIFASEITTSYNRLDINDVALTGYICKPPVYRTTPLGRTITDIMLAVNRQSNKSDYIPCVIWGRNADYCKNLPLGTKLSLKGRIQSREYMKVQPDNSSSRMTAYEVSVCQLSIVTEDVSDENTRV